MDLKKYESALDAIKGVWIPGFEGKYAWSLKYESVYSVKGWKSTGLLEQMLPGYAADGTKRYWNLKCDQPAASDRKRFYEQEILSLLKSQTSKTSQVQENSASSDYYYIPVDALKSHGLFWLNGLGEMYAFSRSTGGLFEFVETTKLQGIEKDAKPEVITKWRVLKSFMSMRSPSGRLLSANTRFYSLTQKNGKDAWYSTGDIVNMIGGQVTKHYFNAPVTPVTDVEAATKKYVDDGVVATAPAATLQPDDQQFKYLTVFNDGADECFNTFDSYAEADEYAAKKAISGAKVYVYKLISIFESKTQVIITPVQ